MTTNIIATVIIALVTNVVTTDNSEQRPDLVFRGGMFLTEESRRTAPTEKYLTTNVLERTTVRWTWAGEQKEHVTERLLSSVTRVLKLKQEWEQGELRTNEPIGEIRVGTLVVSTNPFIPSRIIYGDPGITNPTWITEP